MEENTAGSPDFCIRRADAADVFLLQTLGSQTFTETFAPHNSVENLKEYLLRAFDQRKLELELSDIYSEIYFLEQKNIALGYLKINFGASQTELQDETAMEIERIYVLEAQHRKNIGQKLLNHAIAIAKQNNKRYIWLGVWQHNHKAVHFYKKNGFITFDTHIFKMGDDEQTDWLMRRDL